MTPERWRRLKEVTWFQDIQAEVTAAMEQLLEENARLRSIATGNLPLPDPPKVEYVGAVQVAPCLSCERLRALVRELGGDPDPMPSFEEAIAKINAELAQPIACATEGCIQPVVRPPPCLYCEDCCHDQVGAEIEKRPIGRPGGTR